MSKSIAAAAALSLFAARITAGLADLQATASASDAKVSAFWNAIEPVLGDLPEETRAHLQSRYAQHAPQSLRISNEVQRVLSEFAGIAAQLNRFDIENPPELPGNAAVPADTLPEPNTELDIQPIEDSGPFAPGRLWDSLEELRKAQGIPADVNSAFGMPPELLGTPQDTAPSVPSVSAADAKPKRNRSKKPAEVATDDSTAEPEDTEPVDDNTPLEPGTASDTVTGPGTEVSSNADGTPPPQDTDAAATTGDNGSSSPDVPFNTDNATAGNDSGSAGMTVHDQTGSENEKAGSTD